MFTLWWGFAPCMAYQLDSRAIHWKSFAGWCFLLFSILYYFVFFYFFHSFSLLFIYLSYFNETVLVTLPSLRRGNTLYVNFLSIMYHVISFLYDSLHNYRIYTVSTMHLKKYNTAKAKAPAKKKTKRLLHYRGKKTAYMHIAYENRV